LALVLRVVPVVVPVTDAKAHFVAWTIVGVTGTDVLAVSPFAGKGRCSEVNAEGEGVLEAVEEPVAV